MLYAQIDLVLVPWVKTHGLIIGKEFKGEEVRTVAIVDDAGDSYVMWFDRPRNDGSVSIVLAEQTVSGSRLPSGKQRVQTFTTTHTELGQTLESAYVLVESWIKKRGHTRTPVL